MLEAWYSGEAQGKAVADLLFGDVSPSGRLPFTWPSSENQPAQIGTSYPFSDFNTLAPVVPHNEGVYTGYRGYLKNRVKPLFPFGFGLTYSKFDYRKVTTRATQLARGHKRELPDTFQINVRNSGRRAASVVVQVYSGQLPGTVNTPARQLIGWQRVSLQPGAQQVVTVRVSPSSPTRVLSYFDTTKINGSLLAATYAFTLEHPSHQLR